MPDKDHLRLWVAALRSGDYQQGPAALHRDGNWCCLGVACDVAAKAGVPVRRKITEYTNYTGAVECTEESFDDDELFLPPRVQAWLGVCANNPILDERPASYWNDEDGLSFDEIADMIENTYGLTEEVETVNA